MSERRPLPTRRAAIVRLIETRDDNLPERTRRPDSSPGFAPGYRSRTCPDCLANGRVMFDCETCGGAGAVDHVRLERLSVPDALPFDGDDRDPYSVHEKPAAYGLDGSRHDAMHAREREIEILGRQTRPPMREAELFDEANREPYAWEIARRRMYRLFDYRPLDLALEWLRERCPGSPALSNFTIGYLDVVLPDPLRAPAPEPEKRVRGPLQRGGGAGTDARELRDADMRARAEAGASLAELADEFRVSARTVYRVVNEAA